MRSGARNQSCVGIGSILLYCCFYRDKNDSDFALGDAAGCGFGDQVGIGDIAAFTVDHRRELAVEPGAGSEVAGRGKKPLILQRQQKREILCRSFLINRLENETVSNHHQKFCVCLRNAESANFLFPKAVHRNRQTHVD